MKQAWPWIALLLAAAVSGASVIGTVVFMRETAQLERARAQASRQLEGIQDQLKRGREYEALLQLLKRRKALVESAAPPPVRFSGVLVELSNLLQDPRLGGKVFLRRIAYHDTVTTDNPAGGRDLVELHTCVVVDTADELSALRIVLVKILLGSPYFVEADPQQSDELPADGQPHALKVTCKLRRAKS
ncbi:MAG: hypothetical protein HZA54_18740 [Planctomycetes bacterium]|nr:hypothetical protein [Planctomycetota bacterium]